MKQREVHQRKRINAFSSDKPFFIATNNRWRSCTSICMIIFMNMTSKEKMRSVCWFQTIDGARHLSTCCVMRFGECVYVCIYYEPPLAPPLAPPPSITLSIPHLSLSLSSSPPIYNFVFLGLCREACITKYINNIRVHTKNRH